MGPQARRGHAARASSGGGKLFDRRDAYPRPAGGWATCAPEFCLRRNFRQHPYWSTAQRRQRREDRGRPL